MSGAKLTLILTQESDTGQGKSLTIGENSCYRLISHSGIEGCLSELDFAPRASAVGADYRGCFIGAREITLYFEVLDEALDENHRRKICGCFVPGERWTLSVDRGGGIRRIQGIVRGAEIEQETLLAPLRVRLYLSCPDVWFEGEEEITLTVDQTIPLLSFPLTLGDGGVTGGYVTQTNEMTVYNRGDLPTGIVVQFLILDGTVVNPAIVCDTGIVFVNATLHINDQVEVSTVSGNKYVRVNGEDVPFHRGSVFFSLPCGENSVRIVVSDGDGQLTGLAYLRPKYLGA